MSNIQQTLPPLPDVGNLIPDEMQRGIHKMMQDYARAAIDLARCEPAKLAIDAHTTSYHQGYQAGIEMGQSMASDAVSSAPAPADERALFEAHYRELMRVGKLALREQDFACSPSGSYYHMYVGAYWHGWQARAAHQAAPAQPSAAERYADILRIQRTEAETGDSYMRGLYNGMLMMCANFDNTEYEPMSAPTSDQQAGAVAILQKLVNPYNASDHGVGWYASAHAWDMGMSATSSSAGRGAGK